MSKKAVILLSGGLDSATCLAIAKQQGFACYALSFSYGQRNEVELTAARRVAKKLDVIEHKIFSLPINQFGGSALTDLQINVPQFREVDEVPLTYVPARNTIFLAVALGWAEVLKAFDIFFGANCLDYSNYPDCRPAYVTAFQAMANLATREAIEGRTMTIHAPIIQMTKAEIIATGLQLGVDYALTISCYAPDAEGRACGVCLSCGIRKNGFSAAGVDDPTVYQLEKKN